jgi:hypothetical protein
MQGGNSESTPQSSSYTSDSSSQEEQSPESDYRAVPFEEDGEPMPRPHPRRLPHVPPSEEMGELPPPMPENRAETNEISNHEIADSANEDCSDGQCDSGNGSHIHHSHHSHKHHKKADN